MKEVKSNPKAQQAILEEGDKLLKQGVWDVNSFREKRQNTSCNEEPKEGSLRPNLSYLF